MMEGFLRYLTGDSRHALDLRRKCVFKVVPMINPDGVVCGNYRTGLAGNDLNRKFANPDPKLHPTILHIKDLILHS
jgi:murein tripeptide amidase MpaA